MEYSLPAWLGALTGTIVAVIIYVPAIRVIERHLRAQNGLETIGARSENETKISVARRLILGADIAILATLGYWIGKVIGGGGAPPFR
jgi:hypothetical protein